jgi:hypothetical protein
MRSVAVAAVLLAGMLAGCADHASAPTTTVTVTAPPWTASATPSSSVPPPPPVEYDVGQWVYDGPLAFQVDVGFGVGEYGTVTMWVKNVGTVPHTFSVGLQAFLDDRGRVFAPDYGYKPWEDGHFSYLPLNPGVVSDKIGLAFTLPKDEVNTYRLRVRGDASSPGAIIRFDKPKGAAS